MCSYVCLLPTTVGKIREGFHTEIHVQPDPQQCIRANGCPRGGGCMSSPSNTTWPSGQLKLGTDIKFQRAWACRGVLFDGEVIKMESHPANCNSGS